MLTQSQILRRLNQLTVGYNLTWDQVKYDADRAIVKINDFLGTIFPPMSEILTHAEATYSYRSLSVDYPFIKDEYIHSIIIPFISTEVLARDEEFTTIYNKYTMDYQDGLFNMFSKEFNRIPISFRQPVDQGVFFASDGALEPVARSIEDNLDVVEFKVYYHINNDALVYTGVFPTDTNSYAYNSTAVLLGLTNSTMLDEITLFSYDYATAYIFKGWKLSPEYTTDLLEIGDSITVTSDMHIYADWEVVSTLQLNYGIVTMKSEYTPYLVDLVIPDKIGDGYVTTISSDFTVPTNALKSVVLPSTLLTIQDSAFKDSAISSVKFTKSNTYQVAIGAEAFSGMDNMLSIILPRNITAIDSGAFNTVGALTIYVEYLEDNIPDTWASDWHNLNSTAAPVLTTTVYSTSTNELTNGLAVVGPIPVGTPITELYNYFNVPVGHTSLTNTNYSNSLLDYIEAYLNNKYPSGGYSIQYSSINTQINIESATVGTHEDWMSITYTYNSVPNSIQMVFHTLIEDIDYPTIIVDTPDTAITDVPNFSLMDYITINDYSEVTHQMNEPIYTTGKTFNVNLFTEDAQGNSAAYVFKLTIPGINVEYGYNG